MIKKYKQFNNDNLKINFDESELLNSDITPDELLIKSVNSNSIQGVQKAIQSGATIHKTDNKLIGRSIINNNYDIVKLLILKGSKLTNNDTDIVSNWAERNKYYDIIEDIKPLLNIYTYKNIMKKSNGNN